MHVSLTYFGKIKLCHEQPQYSTDVVDQIERTYEIHLFASRSSRPSMPMRRGGAIRTSNMANQADLYAHRSSTSLGISDEY